MAPSSTLSSPTVGHVSAQTRTHKRPLLDIPHPIDTKDPCPVFDGKEWHLYATGWSLEYDGHEVFHATSPTCDGPWTLQASVVLDGVHSHQLAAPGVVWCNEDQSFHMFLQTLFNQFGGTIEHLTSADGHHFTRVATILESIAGSTEAGIYDPHPAEISGIKYLTYSAFGTVGQPEIYLAESTTNTWHGPWKRCGRILGHSEVLHHNQPGQPDFEWGLEGSQLIELPIGQVLLNAVCFLPEGAPGTRQRVFFAIASSPKGPFFDIGPALRPTDNTWESGENGHAAAFIQDGNLHLFYQARSPQTNWRFGHAIFDAGTLALLS